MNNVRLLCKSLIFVPRKGGLTFHLHIQSKVTHVVKKDSVLDFKAVIVFGDDVSLESNIEKLYYTITD